MRSVMGAPARAFLMALLAGLFISSAAQSKPIIRFTAPANGDPVYATSSFYDPATESIRVGYTVDNLTPAQIQANYLILLQGLPQRSGTPYPALEKLFHPVEMGTYEPLTHELQWNIREATTFRFLENVFGNEAQGLTSVYDTEVKTRDAFKIRPGVTTFMYAPPLIQAAIQGLPFSPTGNDPYGRPFDLSYFVTTGSVNQFLGGVKNTARLEFEFQPSWSDLGLDASNYGLGTPCRPR